MVASSAGVDHGPIGCVRHRLDGCIQHRVEQLGIRTGPNGPADDHSIEAVDGGRELQVPPSVPSLAHADADALGEEIDGPRVGVQQSIRLRISALELIDARQ